MGPGNSSQAHKKNTRTTKQHSFVCPRVPPDDQLDHPHCVMSRSYNILGVILSLRAGHALSVLAGVVQWERAT